MTPVGSPAVEEQRTMSWPVANGVVFIASAAVLVLEMMADRMLAPYVGVSLKTFTGIIGTVLAGIEGADRNPSRRSCNRRPQRRRRSPTPPGSTCLPRRPPGWSGLPGDAQPRWRGRWRTGRCRSIVDTSSPDGPMLRSNRAWWMTPAAGTSPVFAGSSVAAAASIPPRKDVRSPHGIWSCSRASTSRSGDCGDAWPEWTVPSW